MGKDPAFLMYSSDFLTGTLFMCNEDIGIYIKLMCVQHQHGGFVSKEVFAACTQGHPAVAAKFIEADDGYYNQRLMEEMAKRAKKSNSLSQNAKKRWAAEKACKSIANVSATHMPTEDEDANENRGEGKAEATGFERIDIELCGESMPWIQVSSWVSRLKGNYQLAWQLLYYAAVVRKAEHPARYVQKLVNEGEYAMAQEVKVDTALDWRDSLYATKEN